MDGLLAKALDGAEENLKMIDIVVKNMESYDDHTSSDNRNTLIQSIDKAVDIGEEFDDTVIAMGSKYKELAETDEVYAELLEVAYDATFVGWFLADATIHIRENEKVLTDDANSEALYYKGQFKKLIQLIGNLG